MVVAGILLAGCVGPDGTSSIQNVVTAPRVEAVVSLGVYYGTHTLIAKGNRALVEKLDGALRSLNAQSKRDMVAIAIALREGGITWLETPEGVLAFGIAESLFHDKYGPEQILNNAYADAVLAGALRGVELALANTGAKDDARSFDEVSLAAQAKATRPR